MNNQQLTNNQTTINYGALKGQILKIAKRSYQNAINFWNGQECFSCCLMHDFFQNLTHHISCQQVTQILKSRISEHYEKQSKQRKRCINNERCYNFGPLQQNNENSAVLDMLHNVINIMSESSPSTNVEYQTDQVLLDLQYEVNCLCSKCQDSKMTQSDKIINEKIQDNQFGFNSLNNIGQCSKQSSNPEKIKMQCIADFLKEERKKISKARDANKHKNECIFHLYGSLMSLDKQRYNEECDCNQTNKNKENLFNNLMKKNQFNQKQIRRFTRKVYSQKSQQKMNRPIPIQTIAKDRHKTLQIKPTVTPPLTHRISRPNLIRKAKNNKPESILQPITNIQQTINKFTRMQKSVDHALKSCEKNKSKGKSILKNVVFNVGDLFTDQKKEVARPNIQKPYFKRLQRILRCSQQMLKCIGIRRPSFEGLNKSQPLQMNL